MFKSKVKKWRLFERDWKIPKAVVFGHASANLMTMVPEIPNTIFSVYPARNAVFLYYYTDPYKDMDYEYCKKNDIDMIRVEFGGSPYWADAGYFLPGFIFRWEDVPDFPDTHAEQYKKMISFIADEIKERLGIPAYYRPLNDLEVNKRKISGHTHNLFGNKVWMGGYGPQVKEPRWDVMEKAIPPPPEKFADKEAKSMRERVGWIEMFTDREVPIREVRDLYNEAFAKIFEVEPEPMDETDVELQVVDQYTEKLTSEDWLLAMSEEKRFGDIPSDVERTEKALKISGGPLIRVVALKKGDRIYDLHITGSIHCTPITLIEDMEKTFKGIDISESAVRARVEAAFKQGQVAVATPEDFVKVIMEALKE
ncbi:MAG: lipoate--protein ligase family protein [Candidatus Freyarchaeota archaeon]